MNESITVQLKNVRMMLPLGLLPQEKILQNIIIINLSVTLTDSSTFLDYATLYQHLQKTTEQAFGLLEDFAKSLSLAIQLLTDKWICIDISIEKIHPPIPSFDGSACINYKIER